MQMVRETVTADTTASSLKQDTTGSTGSQALKNLTPEQIAALAAKNNPQPDPLLPLLAPVHAIRRPEFSVIVCSPSPANDQKFENMKRCYQNALAGEDYEICRISDATGMAEGYLRGLEQTTGRIVIFSHDDAAPLCPIAAKLRSHLRRVDIVGGAGSDRLDGPAWFTAGPPHLFGQVLNFMPDGTLMLSIYSVPKRLVEGVVALDGFWMAANRHSVGLDHLFDAELCDTFHMYDVDATQRAVRAGLRIGVATDLHLAHASTGGYGDKKWCPAADRWLARYGGTLPSRKDIKFQLAGVQGKDVPSMLAIMEGLVVRTD